MEDKLNEITLAQALMIGLGLAGFYYFMVFKATNPEAVISQVKTDISMFEGEIKKFDKKIAEGEEIKEKIKVLEQELKVKFAFVGEKVSKNEMLQALSVEARNAGLGIESIAEGAKWSPLTSLEFLEVPTVVTGEFNQVMQFLSNLSRQQKLITVESFDLNSSMDVLADDGVERPAIIRLNVFIRVYRKIPGSDEYTPGAGSGEENV